ncbi:MAG: DNA-directed RNA polymerase subunit P [Candidatus Nanoarchaeia archaeon]
MVEEEFEQNQEFSEQKKDPLALDEDVSEGAQIADVKSIKEDDQSEPEKTYEHPQAEYKCFSCNKLIDESYIRKKVRCPYCGSKVIFKARKRETTIKAR